MSHGTGKKTDRYVSLQTDALGRQRVKAVMEWGRTPPAGRGDQKLARVSGTGPSSRLVGRILVDGEFVHPSWLPKRVRQKRVHNVHLKHLVWCYHDFGFGNSLSHVGRETVRWLLKLGFPTAIRPWNSQPVPEFPYADDEMLKESAVIVMDRYPVPDSVVSVLLKDAPFVAGYYMLEGTRAATYVLDRLEGYDAIFTPSSFCKKALEDSGLTVPIFVWGHGFDHEVFPAVAPKAERPFTFLWFGDENRRKGYDLFLEAFRRLSIPNVRAWIRRPGSGGIASISDNYKSDSRIVWDTRVTPPEQLKELYAEVDVIVCPYRGEGFCLAPGTLIDTLDGPTCVEKIRAGTIVTNCDGEPDEVTERTWRSHKGSVISLRRHGESIPIISDEAHPHLVVPRAGRRFGEMRKMIFARKQSAGWLPAAQVKIGDLVCIPKLEPLRCGDPGSLDLGSLVPGVNVTADSVWYPMSFRTDAAVSLKTVAASLGCGFKHVSAVLNDHGRRYTASHKERVQTVCKALGYQRPMAVKVKRHIELTEEVGIFFGLYIAEGCTLSSCHAITLCLHKDETDAVALCSRVLESFGVKAQIRQVDNKIYVTASSKVLATLLEGLFGRGAHSKHIPPAWKKTDWVRHVVAGIFYGDGSLGKARNTFSFSTASFRLKADLSEILNRAGILLFSTWDSRGSFNLVVPQQYEKLFVDKFKPVKYGKTCSASSVVRKRGILEDTRYFYAPVMLTERRDYDGMLYNLHVKNKESFTVNGMATHNCLPMLEAMGAGRASIATRWSGPLDFGTDETTYWLDPKQPEPAQNDDGIQMAPAVDQIVERMRWCVDHPEEVRQKGIRAAQIAHEKWRWATKVQEVIPVLKGLIPHLEIEPH